MTEEYSDRPTDSELTDQMKRNDYFNIIKLRYAVLPIDRLQIRWQGLRRKFSILNQHDRL